MTIDAKLISQLKVLMANEGYTMPLVQTKYELILPVGASGYSIDVDGNVIGLKLCPISKGKEEIIDLVFQLKRLQRLVLGFEVSVILPPSIGDLGHLHFIYLDGPITKLPQEILKIGLTPYVNKKIEMPDWLKSESNIFYLVTSQRNYSEARLIRTLAKRDSKDNSLINPAGMYLNNTLLEDPPIEIAVQGREALVDYFRERQDGDRPLLEAKVILVGHGGSGKTSLIKQFFNEEFNEFEHQTHGINIRSWEVKTTIDEKIKFNVWDFGGQEIMHATHQFFLSNRRLYLLVLDGRKDEDPEHWLQMIESFGGDSPIIIVIK